MKIQPSSFTAVLSRMPAGSRLLLLMMMPLALAPVSGQAAEAGTEPASGEPVAIFNGRDLEGWKVPVPNPFWTVADGVITGVNDEAKKGSMLWTEKKYRDFELEAEARWSGEIDSGFMFRSPELQVQIGVSRSLKVDMTGCFYVGKYPGEGRAKDREKLIRPEEWNQFRIKARGDTYTVSLNGTEAVVFRRPGHDAAGPIGLQIHGGLPMKIEFRNLKVRELK